MAKTTFSDKEKQSFKRGLFFGLGLKKKKTVTKRETRLKKSTGSNAELLDTIKRYRDRDLGVLYHNGKFYDTNFVDRPVELTKKEIDDLRSSEFGNKPYSDMYIADTFVRKMRHKYGVYDKDGNFLYMQGEK